MTDRHTARQIVAPCVTLAYGAPWLRTSRRAAVGPRYVGADSARQARGSGEAFASTRVGSRDAAFGERDGTRVGVVDHQRLSQHRGHGAHVPPIIELLGNVEPRALSQLVPPSDDARGDLEQRAVRLVRRARFDGGVEADPQL